MSEAILSVLCPTAIDDTTLTSTTVAEADYAAYNPAEAGYALGDRVISVTTHRIYERATATATAGKDPTDINNRIADASGVIWWIDISATNAWKMFDGEKSSPTIDASPLTVVVEPGFISSLYVGGLVNVDTAVVTMDDSPGGTEVYSETIDLENSLPPDYYEYCFSPFEQQPDFILDDLPPYNSGEITVTFTAASGDMEIGMFQVGDLRPLGTTQRDAEVMPKSYSYVKIDAFGNNEIVRRKNATDMSLTAIVDLDYSDTAISILKSVIDVPVVWVATTSTRHAALRVFGLGKSPMIYKHPEHNELKLKVEGLI